MKRTLASVGAVLAAVTVVMLSATGEGRNLKASVEGLLNAEEIYNQLELIDTLVDKLVTGSTCTSLKKWYQEEEEEAGWEWLEDGAEIGTGFETVCSENESAEEEEEETTKKPSDGEDMEEEDEEDEDCDYAKLNEDHTMLLPPNPDCSVHKLGNIDGEEKELILSLHNTLRAKVAQGNESRGDPGPQPSAANMHQLVWNDELAKVAQAWAAQCPSDHDQERKRQLCSRKYRTGQNINYYWGVVDQEADWEQAIDNWYNEVADVAAEVAASFKPHKTKKIGHYTQLVWGTTKEIGCGTVFYETERKGINFTHSITYVCNYGPAGNVLKRPFYEHGLTASSCPDGVSDDYPDLCLSSNDS